MLAPTAYLLGSLLALSRAQPALTFESINGYAAADVPRLPHWTDRRPPMTGRADWDRHEADLHFGVAKGFAERARYFAVATDALDRKIQAAVPADKPALERQRTSYVQKTGYCRLEAIRMFEATTAKFPSYEKADLVLNRYGAFLSAEDGRERAREVFRRLIEQYPNASTVPDAYVFLGELAFADGDMKGALALYEKVEGFPRSRWRAFTLYKKGWCQLKMGRYKQAVAMFAAVVEMCEPDPNVDRHHCGVLAKEARADLVKANFFRRPGSPAVDGIVAPPPP